MSFNVYALDSEAKVLWRQDLGREVTGLAVTPGAVLAGTRDGDLYLLKAADGAPLGSAALSAGVLRIVSGKAGPRPVAAVSTSAGDLMLMALQ